MNNQNDKVRSSQGVTARWVKLNAQSCRQLLGSVPDYQRNVRRANLNKIKSALIAGEFLQNGASIIISDKGELVDGQHRVQGMLDTKMFQEVLIVEGVREGYRTIDVGSPRSLADAFKSLGVASCNRVSSVTSMFYSLELQTIKSKERHAQEVIDFYYVNAALIDFWSHKAEKLDSLIPPSVRGGCFCHIEKAYGHDTALEMNDTLCEGVGPAIYLTLRKALNMNSLRARNKFTTREIAHLTLKAAKGCQKGLTSKSIRFDETFPYLGAAPTK